MAQKEAKARIKINKLLTEAGWRFFDEENKPANICVELNVKISQKVIEGLGDDFEQKNGFVDFLLLDDNGKPLIVLEAKSEDKDPLVGKEQARNYARNLNVKYIILSNGNIHYFWDIEKGNPQIIVAFPNAESLQDRTALAVDSRSLWETEVKKDIIAEIMMPNFEEIPEFININTRDEFIKNNKLVFLRPFQIEAVKALQQSAKKGANRFLFEMATGTGKTLTCAAIIELFFKANIAKRVLFLVDRIELENQAYSNFTKYLKNNRIVKKYRNHQEDWRSAAIVVSTVQTLLSNDRYKRTFRPTDFDLVISDEAHRSINGNSRALFEYFLGYKLGLTATPKDYIKNVNWQKLKERDPRSWERRQMLDTYKTFGCESGEPTYRYGLIRGAKEDYLVNPYVVDARTEITTQLLADEGYSVLVPTDEENGKDEEQVFFQKDFEKKFFSDETNFTFCKTFLERAKKDPISGEIGKSIVFCVSRKHAARITNTLNAIAMKMYPNKYQSDFAMQITSDVDGAQGYSTQFTEEVNNLSGNTTFLQEYKSCKTRVCVTVGMMTTGYDSQDLLNIVLMRPIFSPSDFVQIKGRGTRTYTFRYDEDSIKKENFYLFDFFGNVEYFEEKFDYGETVKLPQVKGLKGGTVPPPVSSDEYEHLGIDEIQTIKESKVDDRGMRVDRELFAKFEQAVKSDPEAIRRYNQNMIDELIRYIDGFIMDKPKEYYSWDKIRKSIVIDRRLSKREILDKIFGAITDFASKKDCIDDEFESFVLTHQKLVNSTNIKMIKKFFDAYLSSQEVRKFIDEGKYKELYTCQTYTFEDLQNLGKPNFDIVMEYIYDNVDLRRYAV